MFHLVVDDSVKSPTISTRNPVLVGLRNALHTAVRHSITTITIPLLLFHEMTEVGARHWQTEYHSTSIEISSAFKSIFFLSVLSIQEIVLYKEMKHLETS